MKKCFILYGKLMVGGREVEARDIYLGSTNYGDGFKRTCGDDRCFNALHIEKVKVQRVGCLTDEQRDEIKTLPDHLTSKDIAMLYGISVSQAWKIRHGKDHKTTGGVYVVG